MLFFFSRIWNSLQDIPQMALPPWHMLCQFYLRFRSYREAQAFLFDLPTLSRFRAWNTLQYRLLCVTAVTHTYDRTRNQHELIRMSNLEMPMFIATMLMLYKNNSNGNRSHLRSWDGRGMTLTISKISSILISWLKTPHLGIAMKMSV